MASKFTNTNNTKSDAARKAAATAASAAQQRRNTGAQSSGAAKPAGQQTALDNPMYFENLDPNSSTEVVYNKKDDKLMVRFITKIVRKSSGNRQRNSTRPWSPVMLIGSGSRISGEGNAGQPMGEDMVWARTKANYSLAARKGNLETPIEPDRLELKQEQYLEWVFKTSCAILGKVFDLNLDSWEGPISSALSNARRDLYRDYKDSKGVPFVDTLQLENLERANTAAGKAAEKAVRTRARQLFIELAAKNSKAMPCTPIYDGDRQIIGYNDLFAHRNVWTFAKGAYNKNSAFKDVRGPEVTDLPSQIEKWPKILKEMKANQREYQYAVRVFDLRTQRWQQPPKIECPQERIDELSGERIVEKATYNDPFWNPLLKIGAVDIDTLAFFQIGFRVKRGMPTSNDAYGIKIDFSPEITVVAQAERPPEAFGVDYAFATGMYVPKTADDNAAEEDDGEDREDRYEEKGPLEREAADDEQPEEGEVAADEEATLAIEEDAVEEEQEQQVNDEIDEAAAAAEAAEEEEPAQETPADQEEEQETVPEPPKSVLVKRKAPVPVDAVAKKARPSK